MTWSAELEFQMCCSLFGIVDDVPQSCTNQLVKMNAWVIVLAAGKKSDGPRCFWFCLVFFLF